MGPAVEAQDEVPSDLRQLDVLAHGLLVSVPNLEPRVAGRDVEAGVAAESLPQLAGQRPRDHTALRAASARGADGLGGLRDVLAGHADPELGVLQRLDVELALRLERPAGELEGLQGRGRDRGSHRLQEALAEDAGSVLRDLAGPEVLEVDVPAGVAVVELVGLATAAARELDDLDGVVGFDPFGRPGGDAAETDENLDFCGNESGHLKSVSFLILEVKPYFELRAGEPSSFWEAITSASRAA